MLNPDKRNIVNDLDLDALGMVVETIQADPAAARAGFGVVTRWMGQTRTESRPTAILLGGETIARNFAIAADEPEQLLGTDEAPNPQELLLSALNACMTVGYVAGAAVRGITLDSLEIETRGELDLRGFLGLSDTVPPGYPGIDYVVRISGNGTPDQFAEIHAEVQKTSPNFDNFARALRMDAKLEIV
jgi:uncharacterized OsmC-like protein